MVVTVAQVKSVVIGRVGDIDPTTLDPTTLNTGLLATQVDLWWEMYADKDLIGPRLRELYTQLECIDAKKAALMHLVDFQEGTTGLNVKQSQKIAALDSMRTNLKAKIDGLEKLYAKTQRGAGSLLPIEKTAPVVPPVVPFPTLDQNDPRYAGDAYIRSPNPI